MLHNKLRMGISPLLETVEEMLAELGNPDESIDCIQIAGTNGKTSTSRFCAAALAGEGLRVGLYTSPELVNYTERMEICGAPVSENAFAHGIAVADEAGKRVNARRSAAGLHPYDVTEFDTLTVAAVVLFAEAELDAVVLECGLGGRWDATTAVRGIRTVGITGIGLDHTHILGNTLEAIAGEKAAIIKPGRSCVLGSGTAPTPEVQVVFLQRAAACGVIPTIVCEASLAGHSCASQDYPQVTYAVRRHPDRIGGPMEVDVRTPQATYLELACLKPAYQAQNMACAVALAEAHLGHALNPEALFFSLVRCPTPGRFQLLSPEPPVLIDACHNPQSVEAFISAVADICPERSERPTALVAVLADKDAASIARLVAEAFPRVVVTQTASPRALAAGELEQLFIDAGAQVLGVYPTVAEALAAHTQEALVGCGSITLAGEMAALYGWPLVQSPHAHAAGV